MCKENEKINYSKLINAAVDNEVKKQKDTGSYNPYAFVCGELISLLTRSLEGDKESVLRGLKNMAKTDK
jgi:hypothetical protein